MPIRTLSKAMLVVAPMSLMLACTAEPGEEESSEDVETTEAALGLSPNPSNCGGFQLERATVVALYALTQTKACKKTVDVTKLQPELSPLDWTCCATATGPLCAGVDKLTDIVEETPFACDGFTKPIYLVSKHMNTFVRVYDEQNKLRYRMQWSTSAVPRSERFITLGEGQPQLDGELNYVRTDVLAVPGDLATATRTQNGLVEAYYRTSGPKKDRLVWADNGKIKFDPNGEPTIICGSFPSFQDPFPTLAATCEGLGSNL